MSIGDWANSAVNLVIGVLLGWSANGLMNLMTTSFWPVAVMIPGLFFGVLVLDGWLSALMDKLFPGGIKPAAIQRPKPMARRLSLPTGVAIGFAIAWLGYDLPFLDLA